MNYNHYITITIKENGKYYTYMRRVTIENNIANIAKEENVIDISIMPTKKEARQRVEFLNNSYKIRGVFLFDEIPF